MGPSTTPSQEPPSLPQTPEELIQRAKQLTKHYYKDSDEKVVEVEIGGATFENLMLPIANIENSFILDWWYLIQTRAIPG
jgi:hypothetical protein